MAYDFHLKFSGIVLTVKHGSQTGACRGKYTTAELRIQSKSTEDALAIYATLHIFQETSIICAPDFQIVFGKKILLLCESLFSSD
jgi:hypothetical protein